MDCQGADHRKRKGMVRKRKEGRECVQMGRGRRERRVVVEVAALPILYIYERKKGKNAGLGGIEGGVRTEKTHFGELDDQWGKMAPTNN